MTIKFFSSRLGAPLLTALALALAPAGVTQGAAGFPGVSKYSYYSGITSHLRRPMFYQGRLKEIGSRDSSVFFDAGYADLLPFARTDDHSLTFLNIGMTWDLKPVYVYGLAAGVINYSEGRQSFGKFIVGAGVNKKLWKFLDLDLYAQVDYDTQDAFDFELGGYPLEWRWFAASLHALLGVKGPKIFESRSRLLFLGFEILDNLELDTTRYAVTVSRRSIARFLGRRRDPRGTKHLAGELFAGFATLIR